MIMNFQTCNQIASFIGQLLMLCNVLILIIATGGEAIQIVIIIIKNIVMPFLFSLLFEASIYTEFRNT